MAVGILSVLSVSGTTLIFYANSNGRTAEFSKDREGAYALAEAGINEMMAVLSNPKNNALDEYLLGKKPDGSIQAIVHQYDGGTVEWYGTLDKVAALWSLTAVGRIKNPTGPNMNDVSRKLTAKVPVTPTTAQPLNNPSWNYIMSTQVTGGECDMTLGQGVDVKTNLFVFGNLCLENTSRILPGDQNATTLVVNGKVTQKTSQNTIGTSSAKISEVHVAAGCKWFNNAFYTPCVSEPNAPQVPGGGTKIFATTFSTDTKTLAAPVADYDSWYLNAAPGPYFPCTTVSGTPPTFDSPVAAAGSTDAVQLTYKNNNLTSQNLIPTSSYSCKVAGGGELTWDYPTKTLTVAGTIYIDGDVRLEPTSGANWTVQYNGQATIYVSGSVVLKNIKVCGGVSGSGCDFATWDPNTEMIVFAANGDNRQADVPNGVSAELKSAQLQGAIYATKKLQLDTTSSIDGPMIGTEVVLGQSATTNDFPNITTVPSGMPGNPTVYAQPNSPELYSG